VVILAGAAVFLKLHSFAPKPSGGLVAPITGNANSSGSSQGQVDIPPVQVPGGTAPPTDAGHGSGSIPPAASSNQQQPPPPQQQAPPAQSELIIPAGTTVSVRTMEPIDSGRSFRGQKLAASVDAPLMAGGSVIVPRGANAQLEVVNATSSGHFKGRAELELRLVAISVRGQFRFVRSDIFLREGSLREKTGAAMVGGAAAVGGAIGGMFHKRKGAAEGAAAGAGAGAAGEAATRSEVIIPSESVLEFHLRAAVPAS
jgi:hypothetical protein